MILLSDSEGNVDMEDLVDEFIMFYIAGNCIHVHTMEPQLSVYLKLQLPKLFKGHI